MFEEMIQVLASFSKLNLVDYSKTTGNASVINISSLSFSHLQIMKFIPKEDIISGLVIYQWSSNGQRQAPLLCTIPRHIFESGVLLRIYRAEFFVIFHIPCRVYRYQAPDN